MLAVYITTVTSHTQMCETSMWWSVWEECVRENDFHFTSPMITLFVDIITQQIWKGRVVWSVIATNFIRFIIRFFSTFYSIWAQSEVFFEIIWWDVGKSVSFNRSLTFAAYAKIVLSICIFLFKVLFNFFSWYRWIQQWNNYNMSIIRFVCIRDEWSILGRLWMVNDMVFQHWPMN